MGRMESAVFLFLIIFAIGLGLTIYPDRPQSVYHIGITLLVVGAVLATISTALKKFL